MSREESKFKPGQVKPEGSGRKPGVPNRKTRELVEALEALGIEPVQKLVELLPALEPKEQANIHMDLISYIYPKRKAVEVIEPEATTLSPSNAGLLEEMAKKSIDFLEKIRK